MIRGKCTGDALTLTLSFPRKRESSVPCAEVTVAADKRIHERDRSSLMNRQHEDHSRSDFVPPDATLSELEKQAAECERKAAMEKGLVAQQLREKAKLLQKWIAALRSGRWTS